MVYSHNQLRKICNRDIHFSKKEVSTSVLCIIVMHTTIRDIHPLKKIMELIYDILQGFDGYYPKSIRWSGTCINMDATTTAYVRSNAKKARRKLERRKELQRLCNIAFLIYHQHSHLKKSNDTHTLSWLLLILPFTPTIILHKNINQLINGTHHSIIVNTKLNRKYQVPQYGVIT